MNLPPTLPRRRLLGFAALAFAPGGRAFAQGEGPVIAAASDLQSTLPAIAESFRAMTGQRVRLTFGASGALAQQIENGAPFEVFLSADESYVLRLQAAGRTDGAGALYGIGRIGLFTPTGSRLKPDGALKDLAAAIHDGRLVKLAIANPETAPYGRAAREALTSAGLWRAVEPRLVLGENVSQATRFAMSGSAQAGIIPLSLSMTPEVRAAGRFTAIPQSFHRPLRQRAVVIKGAGSAARAFYRFLLGSEARIIFVRHGFTPPS